MLKAYLIKEGIHKPAVIFPVKAEVTQKVSEFIAFFKLGTSQKVMSRMIAILLTVAYLKQFTRQN